jgi:hypothetical protein
MKYWMATCTSCGQVKIAQKSKPTTCKCEITTGARSVRRCGNPLSDIQDITNNVLNALAAKNQPVTA